MNFIYKAMNGAPFLLPRRSSLNKLCFSATMTFSLSEHLRRHQPSPLMKPPLKKKKKRLVNSLPWLLMLRRKQQKQLVCLTADTKVVPGRIQEGGWGGWVGGGTVWKIWLFAPRLKRMAKPCFVILLDCAASETCYYPPFPGWVIHWWGLPSSLALHRGVSHKANGPAGPPVRPLQSPSIVWPCASASPLLPRTLLQMSKNIDLALSDKVVRGTMSFCRHDKER